MLRKIRSGIGIAISTVLRLYLFPLYRLGHFMPENGSSLVDNIAGFSASFQRIEHLPYLNLGV